MSTITKPSAVLTAPVATKPATVSVALIHPSPLNPRQVAVEERASLAASLLKQGQLLPMAVRPHREIEGAFELVDGERRWWGLKAAGIALARVECGDFSDDDILRITWTTGTEGKGLTVLEQARWAQKAMARPGATLESVGALVGVTGSSLHQKLALLELPDFAQAAVQSGALPPSTAYLIAGVPGPARERFAKEVLHPDDEPGPISYTAAEALRRGTYARTLKGAPFDTADATLVVSAGACGTCRFRAGNNVEEYGEVKNPHTCMHVACFAEKEASARARRVAKEEGKVALSAEENAAVFPVGVVDPVAASGYVAASRPIPAELVKDEVAAEGAPTFAEVSPSAQVFVGTDGNGRLVDLVKVRDALALATEPAIFRAEVVTTYGLRDNEAGHHRNSDDEVVKTPAMRDVSPAKSEPTKGSIAGEEKREARAQKAAEKSKVKKLRECAEWMLDLYDALSAPAETQPAGYAYTRASLKWEHLVRSVPDEDALLVLRALSEDDPVKGQSGKDALKEFVAGIGGASELDAVCDLLLIASALRAQGAQAEWVVEWHRHLVEPVGVKPVAGEEQAQADLEKSYEAPEQPEPITLSAEEAGGLHPVTYQQTKAERAADAECDRIAAVSEFTFNKDGVCTNSESVRVRAMPPKTSCAIRLARAPDGVWRYGYDFKARGTSLAQSCGLPSVRGEGFSTREEALKIGLSIAAGWFREDKQALAAVQAALKACSALEVPADDAVSVAALHTQLDAMLPGLTPSARATILAKYIKRVCKVVKPEAELTSAELAKISDILALAQAGRAPAKGRVATAAEGNDD